MQVAQFLNIGALIDGRICAARGFTCNTARLSPPTLAGTALEGPTRILIPRTAIRHDPEGALMALVLRCQIQGDRYLLHPGLESCPHNSRPERMLQFGNARPRPEASILIQVSPAEAASRVSSTLVQCNT